MSYFPNQIMPLTPKQTPPEANPTTNRYRITSQQYNMHDEELQAIELFIGTFDKTGKIRTGILGDITDLIDQINTICVGGICSSSGAVQSGQLMTFPEDATVTYLNSTLSPYDATIDVFSTSGFPNKGVISIVNDIVQGKPNSDGTWSSTTVGGTSIVEWIRYDGKTPTSFLNCQRAYLGTTSGTHTGAIENFDRSKDGNKNIQDQCMPLQSFPYEICQFRYQSWRNSTLYSCPILGLVGSLEYIEDYVRLQPSAISIFNGTDAASLFIATANQLNILGTRSDGTLFLISSDANYNSKEQLSSYEAYSWAQLAFNNGLVQLNKKSTDFDWADGAIPVFSGKLGLQFSLGALNGAQHGDSEGSFDFTAAVLSLGADGTLYSYLNGKRNGPQSQSFNSIIYYQTMLIPSVRTTDERNG